MIGNGCSGLRGRGAQAVVGAAAGAGALGSVGACALGLLAAPAGAVAAALPLAGLAPRAEPNAAHALALALCKDRTARHIAALTFAYAELAAAVLLASKTSARTCYSH